MRKIILGLFIILFCSSIGIADNQEKKLSEEEKTILKKAIEIIKKHKERELLELMREASKPEEKYDFSFLDGIKPLEEKKKDDLSWFNKYGNRSHPSTILVTKTEAEKLEEENDRIEDLLRELRNEKSDLEWDMMRYKSDLEWHMLELSSRLESDLLFNPLLSFPFDYRYTHPGYSTQQTQRGWTNYDTTKFLFKLHRLSKGKMDWSKSWRLRLLLNNK